MRIKGFVLGTGLILLAVVRLALWKQRQNEAVALCHHLAFAPSSLKFQTFSGGLEMGLEGRGQLSHPRFEGRGLPLEVTLPFFPEGIEFGREVSVSGRFRCSLPRRNPGNVADGLMLFKPPRFFLQGKAEIRVLPQSESWGAWLRRRILNHLQKSFARHPGLLGLEWALWTGDASRLPPILKQFYLEGGLLQILALSGQHVMGMSLAFSLLLRAILVCGWRWGITRSYFWAERALGLICAWILFITSLGTGSMVRTLAAVGLNTLLQWRRFQISRLQKICSLMACQLIWSPSLLSSPSYLLSAGITALALGPGQDFRTRFSHYGFTAILTPWLVMPLTAFFFAKISFTAALWNFLLGGVWDLILIPLGFLLPLVSFCPPLLSAAEWTWQKMVWGHEWVFARVNFYYLSVPRPTLGEWMVIEILMVVILGRIWVAARRKANRFP